MNNHWTDKPKKSKMDELYEFIKYEWKTEDIPKWDFQTALSDTIKERYESQYVHIVEVSSVVNRRMIIDPEETVRYGKEENK